MSNTIQTPHYLAQQAAWKMKRILPGDDLTPIIDSMHAHAAAVIDKLKELGYTAEIRVEERQFVDIWLEVGWGAA